MKKEQLKNFGSKKLVQDGINFLLAQSSLLRGIMDRDLLSGRSREIAAMIGSLLGTTNAIAILLQYESRFLNEAIMLSRGFFERIVNVCYLLVCKNDSFDEWRSHTLFRAYLGMDRSFVAGGKKISLVYQGKDIFKKNEMVKKVIKNFSSKTTSKPIHRWPNIPIEERLKIVEEKSNSQVELFLAYQVSFYKNASEALHGSFYGSTFHLGTYTPGVSRTKEEIEKNARKEATLLLWNTADLLRELIELLKEKNDNEKMSGFVEKATLNSKTFLSKMEKALGGES